MPTGSERRRVLQDKSQRFEIIIAPDFGLDTAILHSTRRGLFMDSSWRNKNAYRCPVTMISTMDDFHRMVPSQSRLGFAKAPAHPPLVAVMVSNHIDSQTYTTLLREVRDAVYRRAEGFYEGQHDSCTFPDYDPEVWNVCIMDIVQQDGEYSPPLFMIDSDDAERNAIESVFPRTVIRVCQFHFMQGIRGTCMEMFGRSDGAESSIQAVFACVRRAQRCPHDSRWPEYLQKLGRDVTEIADDEGETWDHFRKYLHKTWFAPRWLRYVIDFGMPPDQTRDGAWSTNNYAEVAWKIFDKVFLNGRANRR